MKQEELKGCPFCGGKARTAGVWSSIHKRDNLMVSCECGAVMHEPVFTFLTQDEIIAAWNRRSPCRCKQTEG